jgi:hypothetical protein
VTTSNPEVVEAASIVVRMASAGICFVVEVMEREGLTKESLAMLEGYAKDLVKVADRLSG